MEIPDAAITAAFTAILGGVGYGFQVLWNRITKAADKCEKDRDKLWGAVQALEMQINDCPVDTCPIRNSPHSPPVAYGTQPPFPHGRHLPNLNA